MKKSFFLVVVLFFAFKTASFAQNSVAPSPLPTDVPHGFTYDFEKVQTAIMRELIQPSEQTKEAKQLISSPSFPKLTSPSIDEDYKKKLVKWMESNPTLIINAFKNNQEIVTPY